MVDQVFELFDIQADYNLNLMLGCQTLSHITCKVIDGLKEIFINEKPNLVIVREILLAHFLALFLLFIEYNNCLRLLENKRYI